MLRFYCLWDDRQALFGDRRPYRLHYFLEDGSCEILETREANSGREPFPVFLRRGLLPKVRQQTYCMLMSGRGSEVHVRSCAVTRELCKSTVAQLINSAHLYDAACKQHTLKKL